MARTLLEMTAAHRPAIDILWQTCFPADTPDDRALLLDLLLKQGQGFAFGGDDGLHSMLFCLPAAFCDNGYSWPVAYVYAVGTHPDHRRQGLAAALLHTAHERMRASGLCACFLHPASPELQTYYERMGYLPFLVQEDIREDKDTTGCEQVVSPAFCSVEEYAARRTQVLTGLAVPHIRWDVTVLRAAIRLAQWTGGGPLSGEGFFGLVEVQGETIHLSEGGYLPSSAEAFLRAISRRNVLQGALPVTKNCGAAVGWWHSLNDTGAALYARTSERRPYMGLTLG